MNLRAQIARLRHRRHPPARVASTPALEGLARNWGMLAREDPLWAILADPAKKGGRWDPGEFLATGEHEIGLFLECCDRAALLPGRGRALDFGCGVGRLTRALARHFERVDGVDISEEMLEHARRMNSDVPACHFVLSASNRLPFDSRSMDLSYSRLVLQHMETALALTYVGELVRVIRPGGVAHFQAPARYLPGDWGTAFTPVQLELGTAVVEMHAHPRARVEEAVAAAGGRILEVRSDNCAGEAFEGLSYTVTR